ncbi:MAG: DNA-directed RNA polymerase subunit H [Candidatus Aenigmarchaeota archaeon]|nr:DNA-directed RNA polymerase subunit H [Candidatus Aenigmarchaeota archaeon]
MMEEQTFNVFESRIVPKHEIINDEEKAEILLKLNATLANLPHIEQEDPVAKKMGAKKGDVLKITRVFDGEPLYFYRVVA